MKNLMNFCVGSVIFFLVSWMLSKKPDVSMTLNGAWGTLAVGVFGDLAKLSNHGRLEQIGIQALGVVSVFAWVVITSFILFFIIKKVIGLRVTEKEELRGLDIGEHGSEAYNGFQIFSNM